MTTPQVHRFYHHLVQVLDDETVQLGTGCRAVRIAGPAAQTLNALEHLVSEQDAAGTAASSRGDEPSGGAEGDLGGLAAQLAAAGFGPPHWGLRPEAGRRAFASVLVDGLCGTGTELVRLLIMENIGTVVVRDAQDVGAEDIGRGFTGSQRGMNRALAYARRARLPRRNQALLVTDAQEDPPPVDLYIMVRHAQGYLPALSGQWEAVSADQALLPVTVGEESCSIGPLLTGAGGLCAQCLRQQAVANDQHWERLSDPAECPGASAAHGAQHTAEKHSVHDAGREADRDLARAPGSSAQAIPLVVQAWCAAASARQVLTIVDGRFRAAADGHALIIDTQTGGTAQHSVSPHPECACQTQRAGAWRTP